MSVTLLSSPLQGFTDFRFRNSFNQYFGGIDTFYAPYIRLNGKFDIKPAYQKDIALKNNELLNVIPQIMTNDADEFLFVVKYIQSLGYNELNWNLGCPYPMVVNKCMGSGLIQDVKRIEQILERVHNESNVTVSMKMRLGYDNNEEILEVLPMLDQFPIKNVAIHARIGKQLYKGGVDLDGFERCLSVSKQKIYYNGDITSLESFNMLHNRFPQIDHWMIGRGLISNPFLPQMIKNNSPEFPADKIEVFSKFHDTLFHEFEQSLSGAAHLIIKMHSFWEYFIGIFPEHSKALKKIKKAKSINDYDRVVKEILSM